VSRAPDAGAAAWQAILEVVAAAFTRPGYAIFADLVAGWVLTPGRRTITRIIEVVDGEGRRAHDAYHRFVRDGAWQMSALWRLLAVRVVETLCEADASVELDLDDTVVHKSGRRIDGAGVFRDAVRSTHRRVVYALGLNLVVATVRVTPPWGGMPLGLPVHARVRRKHGGPTTREPPPPRAVERDRGGAPPPPTTPLMGPTRRCGAPASSASTSPRASAATPPCSTWRRHPPASPAGPARKATGWRHWPSSPRPPPAGPP
jgi:hypothetical protein